MNFGKKLIAFLTVGTILTIGTTQIFASVLTSEQAKILL